MFSGFISVFRYLILGIYTWVLYIFFNDEQLNGCKKKKNVYVIEGKNTFRDWRRMSVALSAFRQILIKY